MRNSGQLLCVLLALITPTARVLAQQQSAGSLMPRNAPQPCWYYRSNARFDTCACGAVADYATIELQKSDEPLAILIDGFETSEERPGVGMRRAEIARLYLINERGVEPERISLRWTRVPRRGIGEWGGTVNITLLSLNSELPPLQEADASWQHDRR